jgi:hypothetical protein
MVCPAGREAAHRLDKRRKTCGKQMGAVEASAHLPSVDVRGPAAHFQQRIERHCGGAQGQSEQDAAQRCRRTLAKHATALQGPVMLL